MNALLQQLGVMTAPTIEELMTVGPDGSYLVDVVLAEQQQAAAAAHMADDHMSALNFKAAGMNAGNSNGTAGALPIQHLPPAVPAATAPAKHFAEQGYLRRSQLLIHHETNLTMCLMFLTSIMFAWYGIRQAVSTYKVTPRARDLMRRFGFFDYLDHGGTADEKATCLRLILSHSSKDLSTIIADCSHVPGQVLTACLYIASILITTVDFNIINYARTDGTWFLYVAVNWIRKCSLLCLIMVLAFPLPKDDQFWTICAVSSAKMSGSGKIGICNACLPLL